MDSQLFYGDNLEVLRKSIPDESIDLCYIDPPFNSKRDYNQIYNNIGSEDKAQAIAFVDTWDWDNAAEAGYREIINAQGDCLYNIQTVNLINGLHQVLGAGSLLAYIVSMTLRIVEIHRVLKPTGSFYLHCDPTASHYLKLVLDSVFCPQGGEYQNEITWKRYAVHSLSTKRFDAITDTIFFYSKMKGQHTFNRQYETFSEKELKKRFPHIEPETNRRFQHVALEQNANRSSRGEIRIIGGKETATDLGWRWTQETFDERLATNPHLIYWTSAGRPRYKIYADEYMGRPIGSNWTDIPYLSAGDAERLGYPTQKPEKLLERIVEASSNKGDIVLDAYCGCGTTVAVAQKLKRKWIGIDITYQSISLILKRLEESYGKKILDKISIAGIPKDIRSAEVLAKKPDDKTRKEFEKWAILTYSNNRAFINEKKGSDKGIDGIAKILTASDELKDILFSVKSGKVGVAQIRDFRGVIDRDNAVAGIFITLQNPTKDMVQEAKQYGVYVNELTKQQIDKIKIVTIKEILNGERLDLPMAINILKKAERKTEDNQTQMEI